MFGDEIELTGHPKFAKFNQEGTFIIGTLRHAAVIKDNQLLDSWDSSNAMTTWAIKIDEEKTKEALEFLKMRK